MTALLRCSTELRTIGADATSMEEVASDVVRHLREQFVNKESGESALPLVRLYVTKRCAELEPASQDFARAAGSDAFGDPNVVCLTLLATAGEEPAWNDRKASVSHRAIPLPSVEALLRSPMISQLVAQLGLDPRHVIEPDPVLLRDIEERTYNVFYVPETRDSPYVPAQDGFVLPYGIRSALGFGGVLPNGALFAVILFSTVPIPASAVDAFAAIALSVKIAVLPHVDGAVFRGDAPPARSPKQQAALDVVLLQSHNSTLTSLLDARAGVVEQEAARLERDAIQAEERATELAASRAALAVSEARKTAILDGALDCIIGMDSHGRITDFNRAAETAFGYARHEVIGELLADVMIPYTMRERHRLGLAHLLETGVGPVLGRRLEVNAVRRDGTEFPVELAVTQVADAEPLLFTGYVRDITARKQSMVDLSASRERLAHIARTLQNSLLPPVLPDIRGVELAAAFRALGDGYEVGGDFYDAFELSDGNWALTLGDVCGKGSEAAVITALARYTLRAAAMRSRDPEVVLQTLNEAIHRQHPNEYCTAVYATLDPRSGVLEVTLAGHPHPLLLSAAGDVTAVGTSSPLLGPYAEWHGATDAVVLNPGDTLFLYSDGVTDARAGKDFYGDERLVTTLRAATGLRASAAVDLLQTSVLDFAGVLNDDLAILAIQRPALAD